MFFEAEVTDFRSINNVLRSLAYREYAVFRAMEEGLKITVDDMKSMETSAYIPISIFSDYRLADNNEILFKISLKSFIIVLSMFGDEGNPCLKLSYKENGAPLCMILNHAEDNITIDCEIKTLNNDDCNDLNLANVCNTSKIVINANTFEEILNRLDISADELEIEITNDPPQIKFKSFGIAGEAEAKLSKNSDSVTMFECSTAITSTYAFSTIRHLTKIARHANKVALSTGENGLLGLQFVVKSGEKQLFVEYFATPLFAVDE